MQHDEKFWLIMFSMLATAVVTLTLGVCRLYNCHIEKMAELGYQKESIVGAECPVWRKVDGQ
jgi:hypothetical protein